MLRWACGWTRRDRVRNEDVRAVMKTAPIQLKMREQRLRWCGHSDEDGPDPAEDERAAPEVVWTRPQKTRGSPHKVGPRFRGTREVSERSPKEKMEGRHQERSRRSRRHSR
ncbi:unnamed protein product [Heligmosomoides polygyrus]|uniref:Uncharacterized protein n=1 Tax=Heligmosomoides polygyrus TaxID=6339 RepID=A0A183GGU7_HELPZ|nr:unnamed protein product [Heligmosomoides polygyrus]